MGAYGALAGTPGTESFARIPRDVNRARGTGASRAPGCDRPAGRVRILHRRQSRTVRCRQQRAAGSHPRRGPVGGRRAPRHLLHGPGRRSGAAAVGRDRRDTRTGHAARPRSPPLRPPGVRTRGLHGQRHRRAHRFRAGSRPDPHRALRRRAVPHSRDQGICSRPAPHQPPGPVGSGPEVSFARSGLHVPWNDAQESLLELAEACDVPVQWSCATPANSP